MKKIYILAFSISLVLSSNIQSVDLGLDELKNAFDALVSNATHYCQCGNNTLAPVDCHTQCKKSGWTGNSSLTKNGIKCECGNGSWEAVDCISTFFPKRCVRAFLGGSGWEDKNGDKRVFIRAENRFEVAPKEGEKALPKADPTK